MSTRDRNFRPARRHSFDDDNYQPPTRDFGFASRPSILRFETPSGPPVRAIVKWYNPDKGFGFVELADGSGDAFLWSCRRSLSRPTDPRRGGVRCAI